MSIMRYFAFSRTFRSTLVSHFSTHSLGLSWWTWSNMHIAYSVINSWSCIASGACLFIIRLFHVSSTSASGSCSSLELLRTKERNSASSPAETTTFKIFTLQKPHLAIAYRLFTILSHYYTTPIKSTSFHSQSSITISRIPSVSTNAKYYLTKKLVGLSWTWVLIILEFYSFLNQILEREWF